jgi:hypothetical protein
VGNNFDRKAERDEERQERRESAEIAVTELKQFAKQLCCVFFDSEDQEILYGRIIGMMDELDALVIRDIRPGRELLRSRQIIPYERIKYICTAEDGGKCKECAYYKGIAEDIQEMQDGDKDAGQSGAAPGGDAGEPVRSPEGPPAG